MWEVALLSYKLGGLTLLHSDLFWGFFHDVRVFIHVGQRDVMRHQSHTRSIVRYFLFAYTVLRSIPDKLIGVLALFGSLLVLLPMP